MTEKRPGMTAPPEWAEKKRRRRFLHSLLRGNGGNMRLRTDTGERYASCL